MKTKNKIFALVMVFTLTISAFAQEFSGGIIDAVSTGPVKISDIDQKFTNMMAGEKVYGYEGGIFFKFNRNRFFIKPILLYSAREGEITYEQSNPEFIVQVKRSANFKLERFEAPFLLGYTFIDPQLSLEAGPVYNYIVNATDNFNGNALSLVRNGFGFRVGLSSDIGPLVLNVGYQGLSNMSGLLSSSSQASYLEPYKLIFGIGLILGASE